MVDRRMLEDSGMLAVNLLAFGLNAASHVISKSELQNEGREPSALEYIAAASISLICALNIIRYGANIHKRHYNNHLPDNNPYAPVRPNQDIPPSYLERGLDNLPSYNDAVQDSNNQVQPPPSSQSDSHARSAPEPNNNESDMLQPANRPRLDSGSSVSSRISFKSDDTPYLP